MKFNKEWHLKNKMPKNATVDERIKWHLEHQKNCNCRSMPVKLKEMITKIIQMNEIIKTISRRREVEKYKDMPVCTILKISITTCFNHNDQEL